MKRTKKFLSVILCIIMMCSVAVVPADAAIAPAKPKNLEAQAYGNSVTLYWDEVVIASGYRVFQKVDGKWKKLEDVQQGEGYCYIENLAPSTKYTFAVRTYVKVGSKYKWSDGYSQISVKTEALDNLYYLDARAKSNSVKLEWDYVDGATGYRVFRYSSGKWIKVKDVPQPSDDDEWEVTYTVKSLEPETSYIFAVRPYADIAKGRVWSKSYTKVKVTTKNLYELSVQAIDKKAGSVTLGWDKVDGARGYRVYKRVDGKWKAVKTTTALSYTVTGVNTSKTNYFCVRAYKKTDGKTVWYPLSKTCKVAPSKVPSSVDEICSAYNTAVNNLKNYKGTVKVKDTDDIEIEIIDAPESLKSVMQNVLDSFGGETTNDYVFKNGEDEEIEISDIIPPFGAKAAVTKADVSSASVKADAEGYIIKLNIKKDSSSYDGKTFKPAKHHDKVLESVNVSDLAIDMVDLKRVDIVYPGTTVTAKIDGKGRLTKLVIDCPLEAEIECSMLQTALDVKFGGADKMTLDMTY